jgi:hypothetical protein
MSALFLLTYSGVSFNSDTKAHSVFSGETSTGLQVHQFTHKHQSVIQKNSGTLGGISDNGGLSDVGYIDYKTVLTL